MKKILPLVIAGAVVAGLAVYYMYNKPHRDIASEQATSSLSADEIFDAYDQGEEKANAKFLDKVVEVTGTVDELSSNENGQTVAILRAENAMMGGVSATFQEEEKSVEVGQSIAVKCRCTGMLMDVVLVNCTLSNSK